MRVIRKIGFFSLLIVATFLVQNTSATIKDLIYLPDSSYAAREGKWQSNLQYEKDDFNLLIEFAVYDAWNDPDDFTWAGELDIPETDQYIYAYQIFTHSDGTEDVGYFGLLNLDGTAVDEALMHSTCSQDDLFGGVAPTPTASETQGIWKFDGGVLVTGEHSWFLIFSSEFAPVAGSYEIKAPEGEPPIPSPEPSTLALLGLGSAMLFRRRRKSAW